MESFFICLALLFSAIPHLEACRAFGRFRAGNSIQRCKDCCQPKRVYYQYDCSPRPNRQGYHGAILTVNDFQAGGSGGSEAECDERFHSNREYVVALSTGWYGRGRRCGRSILIVARRRWVRARVVDECDSVNGCDAEHGYEPPCPPNVVDASPAVWRALGISSGSDEYGEMPVYWRDV